MKSRKGFTLIELLIVVAIIGILAAIAVPNFLNAQFRAKMARTYSDLKAVQSAVAQYQLDRGWAPPDLGGETDDGKSYVPLTTPVAYLSSIDAARDPFFSQADESGRLYCDYGAPLRAGQSESQVAVRIKEYNAAGVTYVMVSLGPDRDTDWPWTNWAGGLRVLNNPSKAGGNGDGGAFYSMSNGLNSSGDIVSSSARIYQ